MRTDEAILGKNWYLSNWYLSIYWRNATNLLFGIDDECLYWEIYYLYM